MLREELNVKRSHSQSIMYGSMSARRTKTMISMAKHNGVLELSEIDSRRNYFGGRNNSKDGMFMIPNTPKLTKYQDRNSIG